MRVMRRCRLVKYILFFVGISLFAEPVHVVKNGSEALGIKLGLIRAAKKEVLYSTFVFRPDSTSSAIHQELINAVKRGVKVTYQVDSLLQESSGAKATLTYLQTQGIEVIRVNPMLVEPYVRQHDKLLIVDRELMDIGGRNGWMESYGLEKGHLDMNVLVSGPAVQKAADYFGERTHLENFRYREALTDKRREKVLEVLSLAEKLHEKEGFVESDFKRGLNIPIQTKEGLKISDPTEAVSVQFISDARAIKQLGKNHIDHLIELIDSAKKSLMIESPWVVMTDKTRRAFQRAVKRGVSIRILTNGLYTSEKATRYFVTRVAGLPFLESHKIPLYEFTGDQSLHSKYFVADEERAYVGSWNLSYRSEHINTETGVMIEGKEVAQKIAQEFEHRLEKAHPYAPYRLIRDGVVCTALLSAICNQL